MPETMILPIAGMTTYPCRRLRDVRGGVGSGRAKVEAVNKAPEFHDEMEQGAGVIQAALGRTGVDVAFDSVEQDGVFAVSSCLDVLRCQPRRLAAESPGEIELKYS